MDTGLLLGEQEEAEVDSASKSSLALGREWEQGEQLID
jgi:hypothetical protein